MLERKKEHTFFPMFSRRIGLLCCVGLKILFFRPIGLLDLVV
jgi:hypothetical protein